MSSCWRPPQPPADAGTPQRCDQPVQKDQDVVARLAALALVAPPADISLAAIRAVAEQQVAAWAAAVPRAGAARFTNDVNRRTTPCSHTALDIAKIDLVIANKVLARVGAVDAYGHVSVRHPTEPARFLLARSRARSWSNSTTSWSSSSTARSIGTDNRPPYLERFIHGGGLEARPDVQAVVHGHPRVLLPFTVANLEMRPLFLTADEFGAHVPTWDIRDRFGDTNILDRRHGSGPRPRARARRRSAWC